MRGITLGAVVAVLSMTQTAFATEDFANPHHGNTKVTDTACSKSATASFHANGDTTRRVTTSNGRHQIITVTDSRNRLLSLANTGVLAEFWYDTATARIPVAVTYTHLESGNTKNLAYDEGKALSLEDDYLEQKQPEFWESVIEWDLYSRMDDWAPRDCSVSACNGACGDAGIGGGIACSAVAAGVALAATPVVGAAVGAACGVGAWAVYLRCKAMCSAKCN